MNNMLAKLAINFPSDGQRTAVIRPNLTVKGNLINQPHRYTSVFHDNMNKSPIHEGCTVTFVEQPSCHFVDT